MCGIAGLLLKKPSQYDALGVWCAPVLDCMGARGADSAGLAVFGDRLAPPHRRWSLFAEGASSSWTALHDEFLNTRDAQASLKAREQHAVLETTAPPPIVRQWLLDHSPGLRLLGTGLQIELFKDVGPPGRLIERYGLRQLRGSHAVGHTRMATESAVSVAHAHPFTAGDDFCLVHNGSLSNPYTIRRRLERLGIAFETDNDTEAACRFLQWRIAEGDTLEQALERGFDELDGFYTLLIGAADRLVLVRDAFACKPAVVAESDDYVAIASEFRALAQLPGISAARVFEPAPQQIYSWTV